MKKKWPIDTLLIFFNTGPLFVATILETITDIYSPSVGQVHSLILDFSRNR